MTQTKKLICGTITCYNRKLAELMSKGWQIKSEQKIPKPHNRMTYIANLRR